MVGERLRALRKVLKKKQIEVAKELKLNPSAISQMESGKINPSLDNMQQMWRMYGVDLHWLITGEGNMFSDSKIGIVESKNKN